MWKEEEEGARAARLSKQNTDSYSSMSTGRVPSYTVQRSSDCVGGVIDWREGKDEAERMKATCALVSRTMPGLNAPCRWTRVCQSANGRVGC